MKDIIIPSDSSFNDVQVQQFMADSNQKAIFGYIGSVRAGAVQEKNLRKVRLAKMEEYWFYKLYFEVDGKLN